MSGGGFDLEKRERDDVLFKDKRSSPRLNHEISVDFEVSVEGPHTFFNGFTEDISRGGIFLATTQLFPIGMKMKLSFEIEGEHVEIDAVVRWSRSSSNSDLATGMGLQFVDLPDNVVIVFEKFLKKKEALFFDVD